MKNEEVSSSRYFDHFFYLINKIARHGGGGGEWEWEMYIKLIKKQSHSNLGKKKKQKHSISFQLCFVCGKYFSFLKLLLRA
jgi:hypothetical protein